jgi:hypothetical protein
MPPIVGLVCYLNNFSDGMIHGLSCNHTPKRLHIPAGARLRLLTTRAGGGHFRGLLHQALVDQQLHFNPAILGPAVT